MMEAAATNDSLMHGAIRRWVWRLSWGVALLLVLGARYIRHLSYRPGPLQDVAVCVVDLVDSREYQWMLAVGIGLYFATFAFFYATWQRRAAGAAGVGAAPRRYWPGVLLGLVLAWAGVLYARSYITSYQRTDFLTLLTGATVGQAVAWVRLRRAAIGAFSSFSEEILWLLISIAALAAVFHPDMGVAYQYRGHGRWTGPYSNPNSFGLVMGMGVVLAVGCAMQRRMEGEGGGKGKAEHGASTRWRRGVVAFMIVGAGLMGMGLVKSYSRGAWAGALCGLGYLVYLGGRQWRARWQYQSGVVGPPRWLELMAGGVVLSCGLLVLTFLNLRYVEQHLIRRALSVGNINDFSWRNRATTSLGALQVIANNPLSGIGWDRYKTTYDGWYRPRTLTETAAIELDDYLILGMTLGLPALACLFGYVSSRFLSGHRAWLDKTGSHSSADWQMAVCRAGFLVLLVGFVPETGLFHLALGAPFWILLELGAAEPEARNPKFEGPRPASAECGVRNSAKAECGMRNVEIGRKQIRVRRGRRWVATGLALGVFGLLVGAYFIGRSREHAPDDPLYRRIAKEFGAAQPVGVSVSPDGSYVLTKAEEGSGFRVSVLTRISGRVTASDFSEDTQRELTWRPDSQAVVFQETAGKGRPLFLLDLKSGRKGEIKAPVSQAALLPLRWDPAGRRLVYFQGDWSKGRLLVIAPGGILESEKEIVVRERVSASCDFVWAPDGGSIAVADEQAQGVITLVRLADLRQSQVSIAGGGKVAELAWAPDGHSILATVRGEGDEYFKLLGVEVKSGKLWLRVAAAGDINNPVWLPDGRSFLYQVLSNGVTSMVMGSREQPCIRVVGPTNGVLRVSHVSADGSRAFGRFAGLTGPPVLVEIPLGDSTFSVQRGAWSVVYAPPKSAAVQCPEPEPIGIESFDGVVIPGYHWRAPGPSGSSKGVLIVVHGGLHTQTFPTWEGYIRVMLEQGCDVIAVNYRGSSGYGQGFERMVGEAERVADVLATRDYAIKTLHAPPGKVYLSGLSHGASLAAAAAAQGEQIGGLILISWAGPIHEVEAELSKPLRIVAFHGDQDATVAAERARAALEQFVAAVSDLPPRPRWRLFKGEGHFFYHTASWAEVYWETAKVVRGE